MIRALIEKLFKSLVADYPEDYFTLEEERLVLQHVGKEESMKRLLRFYMQRAKDKSFTTEDVKERGIERGKYLMCSSMLGMMEVKTKVETSPINYQNNRYL